MAHAQAVPQGQSDELDGSTTSASASATDITSRSQPSRIFGPTNVSETPNFGLLPSGDLAEAQGELLSRSDGLREAPEPGEFELYVERVLGRKLPRFGEGLLLPGSRDFAAPATASVPPDYRLNVGDKISISLSGSVEGSYEREIDTNGNIFLPSVGQVHLAGVRHGDLREVLRVAIGTQFRNFQVGVRMNELRGIRVYVTGYAANPGAFSVSSLSTISNAILQAGGPTAGGSFRSVKLIRNGEEVLEFDLYELLLQGNRVHDAVLQNEDVIFIPPVGRQVAAFGSVNQDAIYELRPGDTLEEIVRLAGGVNALGDEDRLILYRVNPNGEPGPRQVLRTEASTMLASTADIVQILPQGSLVQPVARQSVVVRIEGEVNRPGTYFVAPNTPLENVLQLAGGLTPRAYPFGTLFVRESVRSQQRVSFAEALDQLELTIASAPLTVDSSIDPATRQAQLNGARETLERLREAEPDGRLVLEINPDAQTLPGTLLLENNDRIYIPPTPTSVGVFGAVYRPASFMLGPDGGKSVHDYIDQAGGPVRAADQRDIFVVRANGQVLPRKRGALEAEALPGDVIFVPVKTSSKDLLTKIAQISSILFQFGLSAATVAAID